MDIRTFAGQLRFNGRADFPANANTIEYARQLDAADPIQHLRDEFVLPTKASLKKKSLDGHLPGKYKEEKMIFPARERADHCVKVD